MIAGGALRQTIQPLLIGNITGEKKVAVLACMNLQKKKNSTNRNIVVASIHYGMPIIGAGKMTARIITISEEFYRARIEE